MPADYLTALAPDHLLLPHRGLIRAIHSRVGVPPQAWDELYYPLFQRYAALIQLLPASEAHHHADTGGLLQHGLEVARHTLDLKQGAMLPPGAPPESQAKRQDLWTYACLSAALLHDLGKAVTDQIVTCTKPGSRQSKRWSPLNGSMPEGSAYRISFNRNRRYRDHQRIPPLLAHHLIPPWGIDWLATDAEALASWLATIQGETEEGGPMGGIVAKADGLSVARNLSGGVQTQMPTARSKPLATRLLTGLRYLLDNGGLTLNRRGAAAFLDGDNLWLVSKTALDALRTHLIQEGQSGIPTRNDRLMDELQQNSILIPNKDRAIWRCAITIADWQQELTCLCIATDRIWSDPGARPTAMRGNVKAIDASLSQTGASLSDAQGADSLEPTSKSKLTEPLSESVHADDLPLPCQVDPESAATTARQQLNEHDRQVTTSDTAEPIGSGKASVARDSQGQGRVFSADSNDAGERFVAWLIRGLNDEIIPINAPDARVHVLAQGLALVSPGIFRDFDSERWSHVQKRFQKLGLHQKTGDNQNIWKCQVTGTRRQAFLSVMLIPEAERATGVTLPGKNQKVTLLA